MKVILPEVSTTNRRFGPWHWETPPPSVHLPCIHRVFEPQSDRRQSRSLLQVFGQLEGTQVFLALHRKPLRQSPSTIHSTQVLSLARQRIFPEPHLLPVVVFEAHQASERQLLHCSVGLTHLLLLHS